MRGAPYARRGATAIACGLALAAGAAPGCAFAPPLDLRERPEYATIRAGVAAPLPAHLDVRVLAAIASVFGPDGPDGRTVPPAADRIATTDSSQRTGAVI